MSASKQRESKPIGKREGSSTGADKSGNGGKVASSPKDASSPKEKGVRKQRASDLGRALRSIYDDTLRESVPDDFTDLLGKLT